MRWSLVFLIACSTSSAPPPPAAKPVGDPLEKGKVVEKELKAHESHRYLIKLPAGQVARGVVMQKGIDIQLITYSPSGKKLGEFDSPNGDQGPEPFLIEAKGAGNYTLEVKPFEEPPQQPGSARPPQPPQPPPPPQVGRYEAHVDEFITADAYAEELAKQRIASARLIEVWRAVRKHRTDLVDKFWKELDGKSPIVEPYPGDPKDALVTWVLRSKEPYVGIFGGPTFREKPMVKLEGTDLWYLTARVPNDSRIDYSFIATDGPPVNFVAPIKDRPPGPDARFSKRMPDPNNKRMHFDQSRVDLPGAQPQPYVAAKPEVAKGKVTEITIESTNLKEPRKIAVYTPASYDPKQTYPLVIAFDGEVYGMRSEPQIPLPTILDNMIAANKIPPVVAALVANQGVRGRDLAQYEPFSTFVSDELVPKLRADYHAGLSPAQTVVTGSSLGGLCSTYTALHHPDVIGNVLSQSGAYQFRAGDMEGNNSEFGDGGSEVRELATMPKQALRFYVDTGVFEMGLLDSNRRLRDVLLAKGYPTTYVEFSGGHDYWVWRGTISDGLVALLNH